jgi:hypothetical protein
MIYILYFLLCMLGIAILSLPILISIHIVKTRPHTKLGMWINKHIISDIDLEPTKPLEKGLLEDDVLEPPLKSDHE